MATEGFLGKNIWNGLWGSGHYKSGVRANALPPTARLLAPVRCSLQCGFLDGS